MEGEIATMEYVATRTSVPALQIFRHNLEISNGVGASRMLMEMVKGKTPEVHMKIQG